MTPNDALLELLRRVEIAKRPVRVSFDDGSCYDLRIVSTMHAEDGGDVVADVLRSIEGPQPEVWKTSAMNFELADVVRVEAAEECLFTRSGG